MSARSVIAFTRLIDFLGSVRDDGEALALWLDANTDGQALSRVVRRVPVDALSNFSEKP